MTPYNSSVCARARVLKVLKTGVLVQFIDYGIFAFRQIEELYYMRERLRYFPWQIIKVGLHNALPLDPEVGWSSEEVFILKKILNEYSLFWVKPRLTASDPKNDDFHPISVELNGVNPEDTVVAGNTVSGDELGESILERYNMLIGRFVVNQFEDAEEQAFYLCQTQEYDLTMDPLLRTPNENI